MPSRSLLSPDYLAGLFDGEGFFTFRRVRGRNHLTAREWRFQAYAHIVMRDGWLLKEIRAWLGCGSVVLYKKANARHAAYHCLMFNGAALEKFIRRIGPRLKLKGQQAQLMLEVCQIKKRVGNQPVSDSDYRRQERIWELQRELNRKGPLKSTKKPRPFRELK